MAASGDALGAQSTYLCGFCELADFVNKGGKGSPVDRAMYSAVVGSEPQTLPDWTQRHLEQLKSS